MHQLGKMYGGGYWKSLTQGRCKHGNHRNAKCVSFVRLAVAFWPMKNCHGSGDFSEECPTAVLGDPLRIFHAGLALLTLSGYNSLCRPVPIPLPSWIRVFELPCKLQCGQQFGINPFQPQLLPLTSLDQARIGSCSPSSPSRGAGRPKHKKIQYSSKYKPTMIVWSS